MQVGSVSQRKLLQDLLDTGLLQELLNKHRSELLGEPEFQIKDVASCPPYAELDLKVKITRPHVPLHRHLIEIFGLEDTCNPVVYFDKQMGRRYLAPTIKLNSHNPEKIKAVTRKLEQALGKTPVTELKESASEHTQTSGDSKSNPLEAGTRKFPTPPPVASPPPRFELETAKSASSLASTSETAGTSQLASSEAKAASPTAAPTVASSSIKKEFDLDTYIKHIQDLSIDERTLELARLASLEGSGTTEPIDLMRDIVTQSLTPQYRY